MVLNPLSLYLANMVSSDAIFLGRNLTWFALLLWVVERPNKWVVIAHALGERKTFVNESVIFLN